MANIFNSLRKTRKNIANALSLISGKKYLSEEELENLEELLILSDIDIDIVDSLLLSLDKKLNTEVDIYSFIVDEIKKIVQDLPIEARAKKPRIINVVGVNGAGKTTFCAKLSKLYKDKGQRVCVVAADTYRAAAKEQIYDWCNKNGVDIILSQKKKDPSSVIYEALNSKDQSRYDKIIIDTAGRLQSSSNLMNELSKIDNVISKFNIDYSNWITLDAIAGQNTLSQIEIFNRYLNINGIIINKMEGSAKGGFLISILKKHKIPIKFIGTGEDVDDLRAFDLDSYLNGLFGENEEN